MCLIEPLSIKPAGGEWNVEFIESNLAANIYRAL